MLRLSTPLVVVAFASALVVGCGGASGTDFDSGDASAGEPAGGGGGKGGSSQGGTDQGGSDQGGSGGTSSGTGGSSEGGSTPTGGSPTGGVSGTDTGGASGAGNGGTTGGTDPTGGTGGGGAGQGGAGRGGAGGMSGRAGGGGAGGASGRAGGGGQGGNDCTRIVQQAQIALASAQVCNPLIGGMPCAGTVKDLCDCTVPVGSQTSQATMTYLELREPAMKCGVPCLAIVCQEPTTAMCGIAASGVSGIVAAASCRWGPR